MRCVAFAALLLSLEVLGQTSVSNGGKARMVGGIAPHGELRSGVTNTSTCLNEKSSWGPCGSGSPAGIAYATTAQRWSQALSTALMGCRTGIRCATQTLTLAPGVTGIDVTSGLYQIYLCDGSLGSCGANSEAVTVTGGTYTSGAGGTVTFVPFSNHTAYFAESASSGIQETINVACGTRTPLGWNGQCNVTIPANGGPDLLNGNPLGDHPLNNYQVYGTIFLHASHSVLSAYGVGVNCLGRGPCLQMGELGAATFYDMTVKGLSFRAPIDVIGAPGYAGSMITTTVASGGVATITTSAAHGYRPGDIIAQQFTDNATYWGDAVVTTVPNSTTYTYAKSGTVASQTTPGVTALAYEPILDNANSSHFIDISMAGGYNMSQHFNNFFDMWDDENATIEHFDNGAIPLNGNANWNGSFVFSGGAANIGHQLAPVISIRDSNFTANNSSCVTVYNSNGLYFENSVCQASGLWQVNVSNTTGNYQGAYLKDIYTEGGLAQNNFVAVTGSVTSPTCQIYEKMIQGTTGASAYLENAVTGSTTMRLTAIVGTADATHTWVGQTSACVYTPSAAPTATSPFPGTGIAGLIAGRATGSSTFAVYTSGATGLTGAFQTGGLGATKYSYYIVANDTTASTHTNPMQVLDWLSTGTDSIPISWPRVANGTDMITYDVIRITTPVAAGDVVPYNGGCGGGSGGTCGSVATALSQASACTANGGLVCQFVDTGSSTTSAYTVNAGEFTPNINFWPGTLVSSGKTISVDREMSPIVAVGGFNAYSSFTPIQIANRCTSGGVVSPGGFTSCLASGGGGPDQTGTLMTDGPVNGNGGQSFTKGRLNFTGRPGAQVTSHHIITLLDSQPALTQATIGYRPLASANDTWIGVDGAASFLITNAQLAFGAPVAISNYIANTGNGTSWLERLTSKGKTFAVPVRITRGNSFTLGDGSPLSQMKIYSVDNIPANHVPPQSCMDVVGQAVGLTKSDQITGITPPAKLGNLSLNAYAAGADKITLHFCNASGSEGITPPGAYSFLAVH